MYLLLLLLYYISDLRIRTVKPSSIEETRGQQRELPVNMPSQIKYDIKRSQTDIIAGCSTSLQT